MKRRRDRRSAFAIAAAVLALVALSATDASVGSATSGPAKKSVRSTPPRAVPPAPARQRPSRPHAPDLHFEHWVNSSPISKDDLWGGGKPCLAVFWTSESRTCERSVPAIREIHYLYGKTGLAVFGIHTPKSARDRVPSAVEATAKKWGFVYPIALDNDSTAWKSFKNRALPALYLVDRRGVIRATHIGELRVKTRAWKSFVMSIEEVVAETD